MNMTKTLPVLLSGICLAVSMLAGCARTPDTTWFILHSAGTEHSISDISGPRIQLRKVDIPAYLDRNAIVTRDAGGVRLTLADFYAWAEPLNSGLQRALAENLTPLLYEKGVLLQALDDDDNFAYQLFVQVQRFDGTLGGDAVLDARWSLRTTRDDRAITRGAFYDKEPAGETYESLVQAESTLVQRLAHALRDPIVKSTTSQRHKKK